MVDNSTTVSYTRRAKKRGKPPLLSYKITQKNNQKIKKMIKKC